MLRRSRSRVYPVDNVALLYEEAAGRAPAAAGGGGPPAADAPPTEDDEAMEIDLDEDDDGGRPRRRASKRKVAVGSSSSKKKKRVRIDPAATAGTGSPPATTTAWSCPSCTLHNAASSLACGVCGCERPSLGGVGSSTWRCSNCTIVNPPSAVDKCQCCFAPKEGTTDADARMAADDDDEVDMTIDMTRSTIGATAAAAASSSGGSRRASGAVDSTLASHPVFLAGLEEAFGHIKDGSVSPQLVEKVAKFVKPKWQLLQAKFVDRDEKVMSTATFQTLQKALVVDAATRAMQLGRTMETILRVMDAERHEMRAARCMVCFKSGADRDTQLIYSHECYPPGEWRSKHWVCHTCAADHVMRLVAQRQCDHVKCPHPACKQDVETAWIKAVLTKAEFSTYSDVAFQISLEDSSLYQRCPNDKCAAMTEKAGLRGDLQLPVGGIKMTDDAGKVLSEAAWRHYSEFRLRCPDCSTIYCTECRTIPYHLGKSCDEFKTYSESKKCRFCCDQLEPGKIDQSMANGLLVCQEPTCQAYKERACTHQLACGHACFGVRDEVDHPLCLDEACAKADSKYKGEDFCAICWVDELQAAPIVVLTSCGHALHEHCVVQKIRQGKPGTRHTFGFLECPLCKVRVDHPSPPIQAVLQPALRLYSDIAAKAEARLKIEGMLKDEKLITPGSRYYGHPRQYALDSFAYYDCFKCKRNYFGGRRDCEQNAAAEVRPDEEFVCYDCADLKAVNCKFLDHSEFQLWKCRFCCSPAIWFCFGSTHFCDPCHVRPNDVMKRTKKQTKQCRGGAACPVGGDHAMNGPDADCEQNLGCGVCQEALTKQLDERKKAAAVDEAIEKAAAGGEVEAAAAAAAAPAPAAAAAESEVKPPAAARAASRRKARR